MTQRARTLTFRTLAPLPTFLSLGHAVHYIQRDEPLGALWLCVALGPFFTFGLWTGARHVLAAAAGASFVGLLLWVIDLVRVQEVYATSVALHLGQAWIGVLALRHSAVRLRSLWVGILFTWIVIAATAGAQRVLPGARIGPNQTVNAVLIRPRSVANAVSYYGQLAGVVSVLGAVGWGAARLCRRGWAAAAGRKRRRKNPAAR